MLLNDVSYPIFFDRTLWFIFKKIRCCDESILISLTSNLRRDVVIKILDEGFISTGIRADIARVRL